MAHYTFMWELTANNFYQRNCVDVKPVQIIRFIFQFGFRIVWDSDPSEFGILKCPSLPSANSTLFKDRYTVSVSSISNVFSELEKRIVITAPTINQYWLQYLSSKRISLISIVQHYHWSASLQRSFWASCLPFSCYSSSNSTIFPLLQCFRNLFT